MDHHVAVHASTSSCTAAWRLRRGGRCGQTRAAGLNATDIGAVVRLAIVWAVMAVVAQERSTRFQQRSQVGTVRCVANRAIFGNWLMFPQERTAFFSVAGEAGFANGVLLEQLRTNRTVRIVAIGANDFAGIDRMRGNLVGICALFLVAGEAHFGLRRTVANLVDRLVNLVAVVAGHAVSLMLAAFPFGALGALMASKTLRCAFAISIRAIDALVENHIGTRTLLALRVALQVGGAFAVTGLAAWRAGIALDAMLGLINRQ